MKEALHALSLSLLIMATWLAWWIVFAGWGMLYARLWGRRVRGGEDLIAAFWSGWCLVLVFLMLWHFAWRIDGTAAAVVAAIGLGGFAAGARRLARIWRARFFRKKYLIPAALFLVLAAWVANHCLMMPLNFDSGLYHIPSMRWAEAYRIVPGIGNLSGRLAFNQSYFLYVAMVDSGPWRGLGWHWAVGPLLLSVVAQLALVLTRRGNAECGMRNAECGMRNAELIRRIYCLLLIVPLIDQLNNHNISSPTPDMTVFLLSVVVAFALLDLILLPPVAKRALAWRVGHLVLLGAAGLTIKFNFFFLGIGSAAIALAIAIARMRNSPGARASSPALVPANSTPSGSEFKHDVTPGFRCAPPGATQIEPMSGSWVPTRPSWDYAHEHEHEKRHSARIWRLVGLAGLITLGVLTPWAARDVILSGWIAYPCPLFPVPVTWRLPESAVQAEITVIHSFACDPMSENTKPTVGWSWLINWATYVAAYNRFDLLVPLGLIGICLLLILYQRRRGIEPTGRGAMWLFLAPQCASIVFWFFAAPHPRFAAAAFWILAAGAAAFILARFECGMRNAECGMKKQPARAGRLAYGLAAALMLLSAGFLGRVIVYTPPGPDRGFHPIPRITDAYEFVTDSGLVLHARPLKQYQTWDMPLPCTAYVKRKLRLRRPGDLQGGFLLDGLLEGEITS